MIFFTTKKLLGAALAGAIALTGIFATIAPAAAQQYVVAGAPGVANVSITQGDVTIVRADTGAQFAATLNAPLLPGDYISTAGASRAEVQFDGISMLRLAQDTQVRFVNLQPGTREMQLATGTAELAELQGADGGPQIDTPSVTVRPNRSGDYRVTVAPNGETLVTVRSGAATVTSQAGSQILRPGSSLVAYGPYSNPSISLRGELAYDAFDTFNADRDRAIVAAYNANPYISPELSGYSNFASYGQWYNVPGYGQAWAPSNQSNGWTPYQNGQWVWEPGYGYTWVGNEPWGYAPYHYGNWFYAGNYNQWMWQPPASQYQTSPATLSSAWLPALVGFFMLGGNGGAYPYANANIGWVPLAPGEPYQPWFSGYGYGGYGQAYPPVSITNVTNIYNVYRNVRYIRVVRVVPIRNFGNGRFTTTIPVRAGQLKNVVAIRGGLPVVPGRGLTAYRPGVHVTPVRLSPAFAQSRFADKAPHVVPFNRQAAQVQRVVSTPARVVAAPERPVDVAPIPAAHPAPVYRPATPAYRAAAPSHPAVTQHVAPSAYAAPMSHPIPVRTSTTPQRTATTAKPPSKAAAPKKTPPPHA